jgi:hypothetical protein
LDIWRTLEYSLLELYTFCKPLEQRRKASKPKNGILHTLPSKKGLMDIYSLNTARKNDLEMLVSLRMGEVEKRNVLTYVYAYTVALLLKNKEATLEFSKQLNNRLADPQKVREVTRTAGNGYDDAMQFFDEFKKRDFKMWYKQSDGIKRPMKNSTIIEELEITDEEMAQFGTIITDEVKYSRKVEKRRKQGIQERKQYIKEQQNKTEHKLFELQKLLEENPKYTNVKLGELLGVSEGYIRKLKKQL